MSSRLDSTLAAQYACLRNLRWFAGAPRRPRSAGAFLWIALILGASACTTGSAIESPPPPPDSSSEGRAPTGYDSQPDGLDYEAGADDSGGSLDAGAEPSGDDRGWQERMNIGIDEFKRADQEGYIRVLTLSPRRDSTGALVFTSKLVEQPRAAPVLLSRLLDRKTGRGVRRAIAEALPRTHGDWEEGASHLIRTEAEPSVRKALVESMRYAHYPHDLRGLRDGFRDENRRVRAAAARTTGFVRNGKVLWSELVSALFDEDAETRAGAAQSLGKLKVVEAWEGLSRVLGDADSTVRFKALQALERIDHERAKQLPALEKLASDPNTRTAKLAQALLGRKPAPRPKRVKSSAKKPGAKKPGAKKSAAKKPAAKKRPGAKQPGAKKPAAKQPGAKQPAKQPGNGTVAPAPAPTPAPPANPTGVASPAPVSPAPAPAPVPQ